MSYLVRQAHAHELVEAFALLPHTSNQGVPPEAVLVAVHAALGVIGAAVFTILPSHHGSPGVRGDILVLPSQRRRGVGSALLARLRAELRRWDIGFLHTWLAVDAAAPAPFLAACGFSPLTSIFRFEADNSNATLLCGQLLARLRQGKRVPAGLALIALADASQADVISLYARQFGQTELQARANCAALQAEPGARALSFAATLDGELIGFILCKHDGAGIPAVDLWITAPQYRVGWPALVLLKAATDRFLQLGLTRARFEANDEARATLKIAAQMQARLIGTVQTHVIAA